MDATIVYNFCVVCQCELKGFGDVCPDCIERFKTKTPLPVGDRFKYRAWDIKERVMCEVGTINYERGAFLIGNSPTPDDTDNDGFTIEGSKQGHFVEFKYLFLMQCTGLRDNKGNLIYEGDLLTTSAKEDHFVVKWSGCGFVFDNGDDCFDLRDFELDIYHISGNIYQR